MALWRPYADTPLDLRTVKEERHTPEAATLTSLNYHNASYYQPYVMPPHAIAQPVPYYLNYVPSTQIAPLSGGSTSSGYEVASLPMYKPPTPSPPVSPPWLSDRSDPNNYMAEADVLSNDPGFQAFEQNALKAMAEKNGGSLLGHNPRMRRAVQTTQAVDEAYRKQRERNNVAAKQSRDRRKLREISLSLKVAYLKNEMTKLQAQLAAPCARCHRCGESVST